jgi:hypothetical protein
MSVLHSSDFKGLTIATIGDVEDTDEYRSRMKTSIQEVNDICKRLEGSPSFETVGEYFCLYVNIIETAHKLNLTGYNYYAVEIGSYCGIGSAIMGMACQKVGWTLLCFDTFCTRIPGTELMEGWDNAHELQMISKWIETLHKVDLYGRNVIPIIGDSRKTLHVLKPNSVAFSWIDGDHTFEFAQADILNVMAVTIPGGILCVHDIDCSSVRDAINATLAGDNQWSMISHSEPVTLQHPKGPNGKFYSPGWEIWRRES